MQIIYFDKLIKIASKLSVTPSVLRDRFFGNPQFFTDGEIPVEITKNGRQVAPFVAPEVGGVVMERDKRSVTVYEPPEIAPQRVITRKNILKAERGDDVVIVENGDNSTPETRKAQMIRKDLVDLDNAITRREEWMVSQILFTGQVLVQGAGYNEVIQFWDQADKPYEELSGAALWTATATSDPLADIERGIKQVQTRSGITPTEVWMHPNDWALASASEKLQKQLNQLNTNIGNINRESVADGNGVRLVAHLNGVDIYTYSQTVTIQNNDGTQTAVDLVPEGKILFANPNADTMLAYGVVQINDVKAQDIKFVSMKRVPNMYLNQKNPAGIVVETKTAVLPIPLVPDEFYVIKVK